jgi:hypothetical protein
MQDDRLTPSERELEAALGGLKPTRATMNRDQVMFQAGRASAKRQNHFWQAVSAYLTVVLVASIAYHSGPTTIQTGIVPVASRPQSAPAAGAVSQRHDVPGLRYFEQVNDYTRMRAAVLRRGIDALPASNPAPASDEQVPITEQSPDQIVSST